MSRDTLRVLFLAAEVAPFAKVGGLADVAGSLPVALHELGHDVRVVTPLHSYKVPQDVHPLGAVRAAVHGEVVEARVLPASLRGEVPVYLLDNSKYLARSRVYGEADDLDRFAFFSLAALEVPRLLDWQPHVVHTHDWHTALAVRSVASRRGSGDLYGRTGTLLTMHNAQYQGSFDAAWLPRTLPGQENPELAGLRARGAPLSMLALGILSADLVNAVSKTYAQELLSPELGYGLSPLLQERRDRLFGVVNGIDTHEFDPAHDRHLSATYDRSSLERRTRNREALQQLSGLPMDASVLLFGMVSRLADQKGLDILLEALPQALGHLPCQVVIQGLGEAESQERLRALTTRYPQRMAAHLVFDERVARLIYGGCDVFLMPSRFEPCGLGQMIAMRYGALPLVRRTGGLADTVQDLSEDLVTGDGFVFASYTTQALLDTMARAVDVFPRRERWKSAMQRAMGREFSWKASARRYGELYRKALALAEES
ncbi:MAG: glycogen synthase [Chloroflexi bacterium]|nr:glycogen synthase [Chloroflexota bacterium]